MNSKRISLASPCGLVALGCLGNDSKIGDVLDKEEPARVDPSPMLEPTPLGLEPCYPSTEIPVYARLRGPFECAGSPCTPDEATLSTWPGMSSIAVTDDGSNVVLFVSLSDPDTTAMATSSGLIAG